MDGQWKKWQNASMKKRRHLAGIYDTYDEILGIWLEVRVCFML
jgi:hypothetical protein